MKTAFSLTRKLLSLLAGASIFTLGAAPAITRAADEILIGASLPMSGPLAGFGKYQQWGYQTAVDDANKKGGVAIDGKKYAFRLVVRDDGHGMDEAIARDGREGHWGLPGMRERAAAIGAELALITREGGGTHWRLRVPLDWKRRWLQRWRRRS